MMGVGKSTIGKKLARKLKLKFIDIDRLIEKKEKSSISEIFSQNGESYFRKIEKNITLEELKKDNCVIALGGGAFLNKKVRKVIKKSAISIWLDVNIKNLLPRLRNTKKRPLLNLENMEETMNKIYSERKKIYEQSDYRIKCNSLEINNILKKINKIYEDSASKI